MVVSRQVPFLCNATALLAGVVGEAANAQYAICRQGRLQQLAIAAVIDSQYASSSTNGGEGIVMACRIVQAHGASLASCI
jgi:hypothetical protein